MKICLYCDESKTDDQFNSLEHVIPQFLGGTYAPEKFKIKVVCRRCNNNLGLFVDASFAKAWHVTNWLTFAGHGAYTDHSDFGPPLMYVGISNMPMPHTKEGEICEDWLGPSGEHVYRVRPADDRLYWYAGGNPITAKTVESRAYFVFCSKSQLDIRKTLLAFRDAFQDTKVKKISCAEVTNFDLSKIGFSTPDTLDAERIEFIHAFREGTPVSQSQIPMNMQYDFRFVSKLALGVGFALYGDLMLASDYCKELRSAIWHREGQPDPRIFGTGPMSTGTPATNPTFKQLTGIENAITLLITDVAEGATLTLNLGQQLVWTLLCATPEVTGDGFRSPGGGKVIIIFPFLRECFEITLRDFLRHKGGHQMVEALVSAELRAVQGKPKPSGAESQTG